MARIEVGADTLAVRLSAWEKAGALRGDVVVPLAAVRSVRVSDAGQREVRGIRAPGTGFPGLISLGTYRRGGGVKDFVAVHGRQPVVVIELDAAASAFGRLVVSTPDAASVAAAVQRGGAA